MATVTNLIIFHEARELTRLVGEVTGQCQFGDLASQMRRAAISVVCNICEGAGSGSDKQFARYLALARGSANEVHGQLLLLCDLQIIDEEHRCLVLADRLARRLTCFIRRLRG